MVRTGTQVWRVSISEVQNEVAENEEGEDVHRGYEWGWPSMGCWSLSEMREAPMMERPGMKHQNPSGLRGIHVREREVVMRGYKQGD